jgi:hypothetical protein
MGEVMLKVQLENMADMYKIMTGEVVPHLVKGESVGARVWVGGGSGEG